jgi:hypothetical protein
VNLNNETDRDRLFKAIQWSYEALLPFRNLVHGLVLEYAGSAYGRGAGRPKFEILMNLMNQTVDAYQMSLVANRPRVAVCSQKPELRYFSLQYEIAMNNLISEIRLEDTLRQSVLDAFFCMGIVKIHSANSVEVELEPDLWADPGTPFASNVSVDNWFHDMTATKYSKVQFAGDFYRIPYDDLQSSIFDQEVVRELNLRPSSKFGSEQWDERLDRIARGQETDPDEMQPMIDVMDVWIPRDEMIYTFAINPRSPFSGTGKPIAAMPPDDEDTGPYDLLSFNDVPENVVPASPAAHLAGLARIINNIMRKQSRKAHAQKDVMTYTAAGKTSAERIIGASDQQSVAVDENGEVQVMKFGGVDQMLQAYLLGLIQIYDRMAGNLTAMAGLGNQAPTLGQEELIQGAVSKKQAGMQYRVAEHAERIIRRLGKMLWNDRAKTIPGNYTHPGLEELSPVDVTWTPSDREGEFSDYDLRIDVYSLPYQSPAKKFQTLMTLVQNVFMPAAPLLAQQGGSINFKRLKEIASRLLNMPEMDDLLEFGGPPPEQGGGEDEETGLPPSTSREYIRRNVPTGGTMQSQAATEQQSWMGMDESAQMPQPEMAMGG